MEKVILVTGANRGLGFEFVKQLTHQGHRVVAAARSAKDSHELLEWVKKFPNQVEYHELDVANAESLVKLDRFVQTLPRLDWLVNNAGTAGTGKGSSLDAPLEEYEDVFRVNVLGPLMVTRACLPALQKAKNPLVASVSSLMGSVTENTSGGYGPYRTSKAALNMLNKNLSVENPKLTCVVLHPGWVQTRMGGPGAPLLAPDSVKGMISVLETREIKDSGKFYDYSGKNLPW